MYILGIHNCYDSGAALFKDGVCVAAINEERLTRIKLDSSFPEQSIKWLLAYAGITTDDVAVVSYAWHHRFPYEKHLVNYVKRAVEIAEQGPAAKEIMLKRIEVEVERSVPRRQEFEQHMAALGLTHKVEWFDHHDGHAACAYYPSPFDEALVFTLDASGNFRSGSVSIGRGNELVEISSNYTWDSLGFFYGQITELLGFKPHQHEGKVTGLAAYGDPNKCLSIMEQMITVKEGKIEGLLGNYYKPFFYQQYELLKNALAGYTREDVAAAAQQHLENIVTAYIGHYVKQYGIGNIAAAGGLFANVKLNQRIRAIPGVTDLFVFPHMGDGGLSIGAALLSARKHGLPRYRIQSCYLGNETTATEIADAEKKFAETLVFEKFTEPQSLVAKVVDLLENNRVVGLLQGRMEYGPRALGNRSIIYHAKDKTVNDWLNKRMRRTEFMPFAPVTTMELAPRCFVGWQPHHITTRFMTECYDCTPEMKENAPAVVHIDGTARPQIIARADNPFYYDIITAWNQAIGGLCLINTSFNEHEHPIVCTIDDALSSMLADNVDVVVVNGEYLVSVKK